MIISRRVPFKFLLNQIKVQLFTVALLGVTFVYYHIIYLIMRRIFPFT